MCPSAGSDVRKRLARGARSARRLAVARGFAPSLSAATFSPGSFCSRPLFPPPVRVREREKRRERLPFFFLSLSFALRMGGEKRGTDSGHHVRGRCALWRARRAAAGGARCFARSRCSFAIQAGAPVTTRRVATPDGMAKRIFPSFTGPSPNIS